MTKTLLIRDGSGFVAMTTRTDGRWALRVEDYRRGGDGELASIHSASFALNRGELRELIVALEAFAAEWTDE